MGAVKASQQTSRQQWGRARTTELNPRLSRQPTVLKWSERLHPHLKHGLLLYALLSDAHVAYTGVGAGRASRASGHDLMARLA